MSNMRDGPVLKAVADVVKDQIAKAFATLRERIDGIETRIKGIEVEKPPVSDPRIDAIERKLNDLPAWFGKDLAILKKGAKGDRGEPGPVGPVGPAGKDGIGIEGKPGEPGESIRGERGYSVHMGEGPPTFAAVAGDSYIDSKTGDIYRCD